MVNVYKTVEVTLSTHDAGGVTELDIKLAEAMDKLAGLSRLRRGAGGQPHDTHGLCTRSLLAARRRVSPTTKPCAAKFWRKLRGVVARIPFAEDLLAAYYCAFDRATPLHVKATLVGAIAYFVLPVDAIPDVLPVIGFTDDAAVLAAAHAG